MSSQIRLAPITLAEARRFVAEHHSHNDPPIGWIVGTSVVTEAGDRIAVGMLGRPTGRGAQDGATAEVTRVATDCTRNACSMVYGALVRVAEGLGYTRVITYTLGSECGSCVAAAGFERDADLPARPTFDTPSRPRERQAKLFAVGHGRPTEAKVRWVRHVGRTRRVGPGTLRST